MWTRKELKAKGKAAFKANYWKTVLVAFIMLAIGGASGATGAVSGNVSYNGHEMSVSVPFDGDGYDNVYTDFDDEDTYFDDDYSGLDETVPVSDFDFDGSTNTVTVNGEEVASGPAVVGLGIAAIISIIVIVLAVVAVIVVLVAFLINPLRVGCMRFFVHNLNEPAKIGEVTYAFDHNYREVVKTMFWRDLYTIAWSLLLVIPGIVKSYEYRMVPYLLAEDPTMTKDRAFEQSKRMMSGQKWNTFVLDLSFILWDLLSIITIGLSAILYVQPYKNMTSAALYERLRYGNDDAERSGYLQAAEYVPGSSTVSQRDLPVPPFAAADAAAPTWEDEAPSDDAKSDDAQDDADPQA